MRLDQAPKSTEEWVRDQAAVSIEEDQRLFFIVCSRAYEKHETSVEYAVLINFFEERGIKVENQKQTIFKLRNGSPCSPMVETEMNRRGYTADYPIAAVAIITTKDRKKIAVGFRRGLPVAAWAIE